MKGVTYLSKNKCAICSGIVTKKYCSMRDWNIEGVLCGKCYSKKINEHYPGKHKYMNKI